MLRPELILHWRGFLKLCRFSFEVLHRAYVGSFPFFNGSFFLVQEVGGRHQLIDPTVSLRESLFELLDGAAVGGFPITQLDFQLMHTVLGRLQLLDPGTESIAVGKAFIELRDLLPEDADFLLHDLPGLLRRSTGFQRILHFVRLHGRQRIKLTDPTVALRKGLFELLERAAMGGFPVTQFHFQLMDTILRRLQFLHADSDVIPIR